MATSYNPYYSGGWQSGEEGGTPITPDALNHMDDGIAGAYDYTRQSNATLNFSFGINDDTWGEIYTILSQLTDVNSAFFIAPGVPAGILTNGKLGVAIKGLVNRAAAGVYDFIAFTGYQPQYIWIWRISSFTSGSVTPTVSEVYRFTGTAI